MPEPVKAFVRFVDALDRSVGLAAMDPMVAFFPPGGGDAMQTKDHSSLRTNVLLPRGVS